MANNDDSADGDGALWRTRLRPGGRPTLARNLSRQGEEMAQRIVDAGRQTFASRGYAATRIDDIVRVARASHGTFYLYFRDKEDLLHRLAIECTQDLGAVAAELADVDPEHDPESLSRWLHQFVATYRRHGPVIRIWLERRDSDQLMQSLADDIFGELADALARLLDPAVASRLEPTVATLAAISMIERFSYYLTSCPESFDEEAVVSTLARLLGGVLTPPSPAGPAQSRPLTPASEPACDGGAELTDPSGERTVAVARRTSTRGMSYWAPMTAETTAESLFDVIGRQRAHRTFLGEAVSDEVVERLLDAATRAPVPRTASRGSSSWCAIERFGPASVSSTARAWTGGARHYAEQRLDEGLLADVDAGALGGVSGAPVLIVVCADLRRCRPQTVGSSIFPAVQNLLLAATALGLGSALTTLATIADTDLRAVLQLSADLQPVALVPIGWPARSLGPPRREPAAAHSHRDRYGNPW